MRRDLPWLLGLLLITLAGFWPVGRLGFIDYDDWDYIAKNPVIQAGLTGPGIAWAFDSGHFGNWHPLTWLSLMLDCQLFGLNARAEHWINLGIHAANVMLLYLWLRAQTGARGRSFFAAALFAVHPLNVQSVAWIAERKNVLSAFFAFLALIAYGRFAKSRGAYATVDYAAVMVSLALGLMAKPIVVTLPLLMLLLDYWPLGRANDFSLKAWRPLIAEKIPLFGVCLASCGLTLWAEHQVKGLVALATVPWPQRLAHAADSYSLYLGKLFWPADLAIFYPYTKIPGVEMALLMAAPLALSMVCWRWREERYLFTGWFWFCAVLVPVSGIVQVGAQSMADRHAYLAGIGVFIAVVWGAAGFAARAHRPQAPAALAVAGAALIGACVADTRFQLGFWKDDITLFEHVVAVTPDNNFHGYDLLGNACMDAGNLPAAAKNYAKSVELAPDYFDARKDLGLTLIELNQFAAAETQLRTAVRQKPESAAAHKLLGFSLLKQRRGIEALAEFQAARRLAPDDAKLPGLIALAEPRAAAEQSLAQLIARAEAHESAPLEARIASAEQALGNVREALAHDEQALALDPNLLDALNGAAWLLATSSDASVRNGSRAIQLARRACELTHFKQTMALGALAAACAEAGDFDNAVAAAQKACTNAKSLDEKEALALNQNLLELYARHQAYHETPRPGD